MKLTKTRSKMLLLLILVLPLVLTIVAPVQAAVPRISAGSNHTVGLKKNGTVIEEITLMVNATSATGLIFSRLPLDIGIQ